MYYIRYFECEELKCANFTDINKANEWVENYINDEDIFDSNF